MIRNGSVTSNCINSLPNSLILSRTQETLARTRTGNSSNNQSNCNSKHVHNNHLKLSGHLDCIDYTVYSFCDFVFIRNLTRIWGNYNLVLLDQIDCTGIIGTFIRNYLYHQFPNFITYSSTLIQDPKSSYSFCNLRNSRSIFHFNE